MYTTDTQVNGTPNPFQYGLGYPGMPLTLNFTTALPEVSCFDFV